MKITTIVLAACLAVAPAFAEESDSPHRMVDKDGQPDMEKCATCHNEDLTLARPRAEVCTLCHSTNQHSGTLRHLDADSAAVARMRPAGAEGEPQLPLTEDGRIYCGTCHLFHDPAVSGDTPLPSAWLPGSSGVAGSVRDKLETRLKELAQRHGATEPAATFAGKSTTALRLPVSDGALCRHCHGNGK